MKQLNIPYIGIKVESIPTILRVLSLSKNDNDFIIYFEKIGKKTKTITEYLASLRNLKLADKNSSKQTKINSAGINILNDDVDLLYYNLLNHCLNKFPDLKIVKNIIKQNKISRLKDLVDQLTLQNYEVKRQQTLSSYFKFFKDTNINTDNIKKPHVSASEHLEYLQLYKYIVYYSKKHNTKIIDFIDFKPFILSEYNYNEKIITNYLKDLSISNKIRLYQIDNKISSKNFYFEIDNKYYSYFEVL